MHEQHPAAQWETTEQVQKGTQSLAAAHFQRCRSGQAQGLYSGCVHYARPAGIRLVRSGRDAGRLEPPLTPAPPSAYLVVRDAADTGASR